MKLYGDTISPFVRMCLVTAHEVGIAARVEQVREPVKPTEANAKITSIGALGRIPVLETDHHHGIHDSRVIMEYFCHVAGNSALIPDDGVKRFRVLTLQALGTGIGDTAVAVRYETAARPPGKQWDEWLARQRARLVSAFDDLEANWIADLNILSVGPIAVACVLGYIDFRMPDIGWRDGRPKLAAWHKAFSDRPSMVATKLG